MKKIFFSSILVLYFLPTRSQVIISLLFGEKLNSEKLEFGLMVSPTISTITNSNAEHRFGLGVALYFNLKLNDRFYFDAEAIPKSSLGGRGIPVYLTKDSALDHLFAGGSIERTIKAISVPLLIRYRFYGRWFFEAGPQIDWLTKVKDIFRNEVHSNELTYTTSVRQDFTKFDFGLAGGLVYKLGQRNSMSLGLRYFFGLTDIMKSAPGSQKNSAWLFNIYIPIGAGKAAEKRQQAAKP
jgi:hypothetical protein